VRIAVFVLLMTALAARASAHPAPFSYVDVRIDGGEITLVVVLHVFDVGHDIGVSPPERLLDPTLLSDKSASVIALLEERLHLFVDSRPAPIVAISSPEPVADRQSVRLTMKSETGHTPGLVGIATVMFPYDPAHQTFLNFYDGPRLSTQAILDVQFSRFDYFPETSRAVGSAALRFLLQGVRHIVVGPDHLIFLIGLLLLGTTLRQRLLMVGAFVIAHATTLSLAAFHVVTPSERIIEPAVAFSLLYLGADNLLVRSGRDVRIWIALAFGLIHGFSFAAAMRDVGFSTVALASSVLSFNAGLAIGQVLVVVVVGSVLTALRSRSEWMGRQLASVGSVVVIAAGTFWFVRQIL
jgi:hydrogenase/urease accessory protein HupE